MIKKSNLQSKPNYDTLKKSPPSNNSMTTFQGQGKVANPPLGGAARSSPWPSSAVANSSQPVSTDPDIVRGLVAGGWAGLGRATSILNQSSAATSAVPSAATAVAPVAKAVPPPGYYQGPSGKWFTPDHLFAKNVDVGLPAPVKPTSSGGGGRLGSPEIRAQNTQIGEFFESIGGKVTGGGGVLAEEYLPGPVKGSTKGSNYLDVTAQVDGKTVRVNTVDVYADGSLTKREANAAEAIFKKTGQEVITIPKGQGLGDLPDRFKSVTETSGTATNVVNTVDTATDAVKASTVANATTDVAGDALKSGATSTLGKAAKYGGKALGVVGTVMDAKELYDSYQADGGKIGENTVTSAGGIAGSWGGAAAGAKLGAMGGAALGSVIPFVGTAVGGVVGGLLGGIIGGIGGNWFGKKAANTAYNGINGDN